MVNYYKSKLGYLIYKGKDKYQNQQLLKYYWPEDVWFHIQDFSSPHVYLRLNNDKEIQNIPKQVIYQCCQLVKHGSIHGHKKQKVDITYTAASNLLKQNDMQIGQIGFKNLNKIFSVKNISKQNDIIRNLLKTQIIAFPNLFEQLQNRNQKINRQQFQLKKNQQKLTKQLQLRMKKQKQQRDYKLMDIKQLRTSNKDQIQDDDFI